jgi:hypothetical protein
MLEGRKFRLILLGVINNLFWGGPFECNIPYLASYCNSNGVDLDADIALKKYVSVFVGGYSIVNCEKPFPGCRLFGMVIHSITYAENTGLYWTDSTREK